MNDDYRIFTMCTTISVTNIAQVLIEIVLELKLSYSTQKTVI